MLLRRRLRLSWFRSRRARRAQATVELAISLFLLVTLMIGGTVVGAFTNDRTIAANAARQGARLAAALGDGRGTGISTTDADQQIADAVAAPSRSMAFGRVLGIMIYDPYDDVASRAPMNTEGNIGLPGVHPRDVVSCNGERKDALICNNHSLQQWQIQERRREYPNERPIGVKVGWRFETPGKAYESKDLLEESSVAWISGEAPEASGPGAVALQPSPLPGQDAITMSDVTGDFYVKHNPNDGAFDVDSLTEDAVWHQNFHVIDFNPDPLLPLFGKGVNLCPRPLINNRTHPFTNIEEPPACNLVVAGGNGYRAGGTPPITDYNAFPVAFQAIFQGKLIVKGQGPIHLAFTIYSDDGWIFGLGHETKTGQPAARANPIFLVNPPVGPLRTRSGQSYDVIASLNTGSSPAQKTFGVDFPTAGTYPFSLNYTEFADQDLTLVIGTTLGVPIAPTSLGP